MNKTGLLVNEGISNVLNLSRKILPVDKSIRKNNILKNVSSESKIPLTSLHSLNA